MKIIIELTPEKGIDRSFTFDCSKEQFTKFVLDVSSLIEDIINPGSVDNKEQFNEHLAIKYFKDASPDEVRRRYEKELDEYWEEAKLHKT